MHNPSATLIPLALAGILAGCTTPQTDLPGNLLETPISAEQAVADEALYLERVNGTAERIRSQPRNGGYDPLVPVAGASDAAPLPQAAPSERTISEEALQTVERYAELGNTNALIVWRKGKVELAKYWNDYTVDEPMISYSLAKPVTAVAVGRAIELGYIESLTQPVADFFPEWRNTEKSGILVRHLLDMRSGFLAQDNALEPGNVLLRAYLHPRHEDIIVNRYPLTDVPGTRYSYNNATSEMVAFLIERSTGRRYEDWVSEEVLKPIGAYGGEIWLNRPGGVAHSGCCILLPAESFLRLAILMLQDGSWDNERLLPEGYVDALTTSTKENPWAGMGVYVAGAYTEWRGAMNPDKRINGAVEFGRTLHSEPYLDKDLFLFDGNNNQTVHISPAEELIVLRLGKRPPAEPAWDNTFLPNTLIRGIKRAPGESPPEPQPR